MAGGWGGGVPREQPSNARPRNAFRKMFPKCRGSKNSSVPAFAATAHPGARTNIRTHSKIATNKVATASAAVHEIASRDITLASQQKRSAPRSRCEETGDRTGRRGVGTLDRPALRVTARRDR